MPRWQIRALVHLPPRFFFPAPPPPTSQLDHRNRKAGQVPHLPTHQLYSFFAHHHLGISSGNLSLQIGKPTFSHTPLSHFPTGPLRKASSLACTPDSHTRSTFPSRGNIFDFPTFPAPSGSLEMAIAYGHSQACHANGYCVSHCGPQISHIHNMYTAPPNTHHPITFIPNERRLSCTPNQGILHRRYVMGKGFVKVVRIFSHAHFDLLL